MVDALHSHRVARDEALLAAFLDDMLAALVKLEGPLLHALLDLGGLQQVVHLVELRPILEGAALDGLGACVVDLVRIIKYIHCLHKKEPRVDPKP